MIYVAGSLAFDYIMDFPGKFSDQIVPEKIHILSISFLVSKLREGFGGTAGNIAYSLSLFKIKTGILASAGKDFQPYRNFLVNNKIETKFIKIIKNDFTAKAFITTDLSDNQITGFYPGALTHDKYLKLSSYISSADFLVIAPTDPEAMENFVDFAIAKEIPFMFDFGMQLPRLSEAILKKGIDHAQILIANDYEIALLKKKLSLKKWSWKRKDQIIVTTLGEKGCLIQTIKKIIKVPAAKPKAVSDPTGAGDAFRAGFLAGFIKGKALAACGKMGNLTAVYTVEKYGTTTHRFSLNEFKQRYKENYKENIVL